MCAHEPQTTPIARRAGSLCSVCAVCICAGPFMGETSASAVGHAEGKRGHIASVPRHTSACVRGFSPPIDTDNMRLSARCIHYRV